jgi:hypothetical protein
MAAGCHYTLRIPQVLMSVPFSARCHLHVWGDPFQTLHSPLKLRAGSSIPRIGKEALISANPSAVSTLVQHIL